MTNYLDRACEQLGVDKGSVIKHRVQGDEYVVIADKGIKGCPKYVIPLSQLETIDEVEELLPVPAVIDLNGGGLSYRELQALAKEAGIPANQSAYDLREALEELTNG
jgi:hypothetical protein